jgi:hypothetical protein
MTDFKIISRDEWLSMQSAWLQQRDAWLAATDGGTRVFLSNPCTYTTIADGRTHPCDNPALSPQEFFLAVMRDPAIPFDLRVYAMKQVMDLYPEWRPTVADYHMACQMMTWLTGEGVTVQ